VTGPTGPVVLDYAAGTTKPPRSGATFWCMSSVRYELAQPYLAYDHTWHHDRPGGALAAICDAQGNPSEALPSLEATLAVGAHVGSHIVVATESGYLGFRAH
jgi:hypothetical protein